MKFFKSTLAIVLGLSVLCCGGWISAPSRTLSAETEKLFASTTAEESDDTFVGESGAVYQKTAEELSGEDDPSTVQYRTLKFLNIDGKDGEVTDKVRYGTKILSLPEPQSPSDSLVFDGWYLNVTFTSKFTVKSYGFPVYYDRVLIAKWTDLDAPADSEPEVQEPTEQDITFVGESKAVYQKSKQELSEGDDPGIFKQYVTVTYENYDGHNSSVTDKIRRSSILKELPTPQADGLIFAGWYISSSVYSDEVNLGNDGLTISFNRTFYAKWDSVEPIDVPNSVIGNSGAVYQKSQQELSEPDIPGLIRAYVTITYQNFNPITNEASVDKIRKASLLRALPKPEAAGYKFEGWYLDSHLLSKFVFDKENGYSLNTNRVFYAKWTQEEATSVTVTLFRNYASDDTSIVSTLNKKTGDVLYSLSTPLRNGYTFDGWYTDRECTTKFVIPQGGVVLTSNLNLYAKWNPVSTQNVVVSLYNNYSTTDVSLYSTITRKQGETLTTLPTPVRAGYVFSGWFLDRATTQAFVIPASGAVLTANFSLYAKWEVVSEQNVVITLYNNYSTTDTTAYSTIARKQGETLTSLPIPVREGYVFSGWFLDRATTQAFVIPASGVVLTANFNLYAKWDVDSEKKVVITLYNHYSDSDSTIFTTITKVRGDKIKDLPTPVRAGYKFVGWFYNKNCTIAWIVPEESSIVTSNFSLYAKWEKTVEQDVVITLYNNYSATDSTTYSTITRKQGETINSLPTPSRAGYTFDGWYLDKYATQPFVIPTGGAVVTENFSLYAKWTKYTGQCTLVYFIKDYTSPDWNVYSSQAVKIESVLKSLPEPILSNYVFDGWYLDRELTQKFTLPAGGLKVIENLTLYGRMVKASEQNVVVTLYNNYSASDTTTYSTITRKQGETINSLPTPSRAGYTFMGWFLDRATTQAFVIPVSGAVLTSNFSLYAKWEKAVEQDVVITLYNNYSASDTNNYSTIIRKQGEVITSLPTPSRAGYTFMGWFVDRATTQAFVIPTGGAVLTSNFSLYAKWEKAVEQNVVITLYNNHSDNDMTVFTSIVKKQGEVITSLPTPSRAGYTFAGWFYNKNCTIAWIIPESGSIVTSNFSLYAKWEKAVEQDVVVTLYNNYSTSDTTTYSTIIRKQGEVITSLPTPSRAGYTFMGWFVDRATTQAFVIPASGAVLTSNFSLYAKWEKVVEQDVVITLYNNYSSTDLNVYSKITKKQGDVINSLPTPSRTGFMFDGWYLDRACLTKFVIPQGGVAIPENLNLYAKWIEIVQEVNIVLYRNYSADEFVLYDSIKVNKNSKIYSLPTPTRLGYTFNGWYYDRAATQPFVIAEDGTIIENNLALYASWSMVVEKVSVTLYRNHTSTDTFVYDILSFNKNSRIYSKDILTPSRINYTFGGWYLDQACTVPYTIPSIGNLLTSDLSLYAKWDRIVAEKVTITLYRNYDSTETVQYNPISIDKNEKIYSIFTPTRSGYKFDGWFFDRACTSKFEIPADGRVISSDLTLYAKWTANVIEKVTLTRIIPQKDGSSRTLYSTMSKGCVITSLGVCYDTDRAFVGWYLDAEYKYPFDVGSGYVMNENKTIYAKWVNYAVGDVNKDGKINNQDVFLLQWNIAANKNFTPDEKAIVDTNFDGVVDRFDLHVINAYIMIHEKTKSWMYVPALNMTKEKLNLVATNEIVDQADLDKYLSERSVQVYGSETYDSSKYKYAHDFNEDGSVDEIDYLIFKTVADNDLTLYNYLKK